MQFYYPPALPVADMIHNFNQSNFSGKVIIVILILFSIWAWTVMATKWQELRQAELASKKFLRAFRSEAHPISLFIKRVTFRRNPLYDIYLRCCEAVGLELDAKGGDSAELFMGSFSQRIHRISPAQLEAVRNISERTVADQALLLEKNVGFLATAVSTAPFLGLLGTVWGVMEAFSGMAITGAPTLSAVAPGISAALLTTVVGLLVALPSAIGYNLITNKIRVLSVRMDNFAQEFVVSIQHALMQEE